jgi:fibronectin type III domain protein
MRYIKKTLFLFAFCIYALIGMAQQKSTSNIRTRAEIHSDRILLRWIPSDAKSWDLLNQYGVRLERLTVSRSGVVLDKPELKVLSERLKPEATDTLKRIAAQYPMGAVIAQAVFGEDFEVSLGNNPISKAISLDEMRQQRYLFSLYAADLCFPMAKEIGWGWEDKDIKNGERYLYRITPLVPKGKYQIGQGSVFTIVGDTAKLIRPVGLSARFSEAGAFLSWDYNTLSYLYSSYFIEKSEDGKIFKPISDLPVTRIADVDKNPYAPITYLDSIPEGKTIYYRVVGVTPFGSKGAYSDIVSGIAYPALKAIPMITSSSFDRNGGADISWQFDGASQELIKGFNVLHSTDDKDYTILIGNLNPQQRNYHITNIGRHIYYKIEAEAKQGASTRSLPVLIQPVDSVPPGIPQGLSAQIDSLGAVHLSWKPNSDADIYGYRLYRGQTKGEELIPITDLAIRETAYTDSINLDNLNNKVYYALTALDERYNQSDLSETIEVVKPNVIPPTTPVIVGWKAEDGRNVIEWTQDENPYLAGFIVVRTDVEDRTRLVARRVESPISMRYEDYNIESGKSYLYQVIAYTSNQLRSHLSNPIILKSKMQGMDNDSVKFDLEALPEGIAIKWDIHYKDLMSVALYKLDDSKTKFLYRENLPASGEFVDKEILQGKENEYILVVKAKNHSSISQKKRLRL